MRIPESYEGEYWNVTMVHMFPGTRPTGRDGTGLWPRTQKHRWRGAEPGAALPGLGGAQGLSVSASIPERISWVSGLLENPLSQ